MLRKNLSTLLSCALLFSCFISSFAVAEASFDKTKMDECLSIMEQNGRGILSIEIVEKGEVVYQKQTGFAYYDEQRKKIKANAQTQYRAASITKLFTATLIMQLIEQEKLSLTTTLSEFYPQIKNADIITIDHMLRHYSGLANYSDFPEIWDYGYEAQSKAQTLKRYASFESMFKPGRQYQYSNTNYMLLGFIIEDITGKTYQAALKDNIVDKLHLKNTQLGSTIDIDKNQAQSFSFGQGDWQVRRDMSLSNFTAAGGIISTPHDLNIFINALMKGELVSEALLGSMFDSSVLYGRGVMQIQPFNNTDYIAYGHDGVIDGFNTIVAYYPEQDMSIAILANGVAMKAYNLNLAIMNIYFNRPYPLPELGYSYERVDIDSKQLETITGHYADFGGLNLSLFVENEQLWGSIPTQDLELNFVATSDDKYNSTFYNESERVEMVFSKSADGTLKRATFRASHNGVEFLFMRRSFWDTYFGWLGVLNPF